MTGARRLCHQNMKLLLKSWKIIETNEEVYVTFLHVNAATQLWYLIHYYS